MFVVLLKFSDKAQAAKHLADHKQWVQRGVSDGVFALVGSVVPNLGGAIVAHNTSRAELEARVAQDPFVAEGVVEAELLEISPSFSDERLAFLQADTP